MATLLRQGKTNFFQHVLKVYGCFFEIIRAMLTVFSLAALSY